MSRLGIGRLRTCGTSTATDLYALFGKDLADAFVAKPSDARDISKALLRFVGLDDQRLSLGVFVGFTYRLCGKSAHHVLHLAHDRRLGGGFLAHRKSTCLT